MNDKLRPKIMNIPVILNVLNGELIASFKIPLAAALKNLIHILP